MDVDDAVRIPLDEAAAPAPACSGRGRPARCARSSSSASSAAPPPPRGSPESPASTRSATPKLSATAAQVLVVAHDERHLGRELARPSAAREVVAGSGRASRRRWPRAGRGRVKRSSQRIPKRSAIGRNCSAISSRAEREPVAAPTPRAAGRRPPPGRCAGRRGRCCRRCGRRSPTRRRPAPSGRGRRGAGSRALQAPSPPDGPRPLTLGRASGPALQALRRRDLALRVRGAALAVVDVGQDVVAEGRHARVGLVREAPARPLLGARGRPRRAGPWPGRAGRCRSRAAAPTDLPEAASPPPRAGPLFCRSLAEVEGGAVGLRVVLAALPRRRRWPLRSRPSPRRRGRG